MKITIATGPFLSPPPGAAGAIERRWAATAQVFTLRGHEVSLVCRALDDTPDPPPWQQSPVNYLPIRGAARSGSLKGDLWRDLGYSRRAARAIPPSDVIVANAFWLPILLTLPGVRRDAVIAYNLARFPKKQLKLYRRIDLILAVSSAVADAAIEQAPVLRDRVTVVPNPIDTAVFCQQPLKPPSDTPLILYTGRLHPEKGLDLLIKACRALVQRGQRLRLQLRGEAREDRGGGGEPYLQQLRQLAQGVPDFLEVADPLYERVALAKQIADCDIYVYPSVADLGESFGVAPLEAMGVGRPVVVSSLACFRDFCEDGVNTRVFNHRSPDPVAELIPAIEQLLNDRAFASNIAHAAAETATRFGYESTADRYLQTFEQTIKERRRG